MDVVVARIGKAHALRGEVTVEVRTDDPRGRFVPGTVFATQARRGSGVPRELTLRSARLHSGTWLLAFEEIPDRTGAESLRDTLLLHDVPAEAGGEDEGYYESDLVGLRVEDPAGTPVGEVVALETRPAQDLLEVRLSDGRTGLVPFVAALVPVVDVPGGRLVLDAPDGLFDLGEA
ncbi:ribosome maturation factor RimM [Arsenicicoccus sp. oral taxon 190]|uniref:ribosome maturation factor RimM n=1 Tax=Arsenicicoccus sp. oral taxon 190 TaxID=1658671 RepID=UPI000679ED1B|nr:ribosome maturation factor RimM [Arsenicicoccus sp. oral taxon 190]AKT52242.1 ribosome maturation factor RimM [Arsenicicoccus sp. oral taxon 190]